MDIRVVQGKWNEVDAATLIIPAGEKESPRDTNLDQATGGWLAPAFQWVATNPFPNSNPPFVGIAGAGVEPGTISNT